MNKESATLKIIILHLVLIFSATLIQAQTNWELPAEKKEKTANFLFDSTSIYRGNLIYSKNCISCHGTPGKGNNLNMTPQPRDPASKEYQQNTDGELFYKMTEGRGAMPSFKNTIEEADRWAIISYIRSFNKDYKQPEFIKAAANVSGAVFIEATWITEKKQIEIQLTKKEKDEKIPAAGYDVSLWAKRYFGNLQLDETKTSTQAGKVIFDAPKNLPGDSIGNVQLIIKLSNDAAGFSVSKDTVLNIGIAKNDVKILDKRAFWNVGAMAPVWLIVLYVGTVLSVLGIIGYILLLLFKIWKSGSKSTH